MDFELILGDVNPDLCHEWRRAFRPHRVPVENGDFFDISADAYVSPANSHGIMDGRFDLLLRLRFPGVDVKVQRAIDELGGMLPVGQALVVETDDWDVPYLVCAPTMEVPMIISGTRNVFFAMRGLLRAVKAFNEENDGAIHSLAVPGLGTGVGKVSPSSAAAQMLEAYEDFRSQI